MFALNMKPVMSKILKRDFVFKYGIFILTAVMKVCGTGNVKNAKGAKWNII